MSGRYVHIPECLALLWFPDNPKFGQWLTNKSLSDYGLDYRHPDYQTIIGLEYDTVLVNWSPKNSVMAFHILESPIPPTQFYDSEVFKYLRATMDGVVMKGGFLMIEKPMDVVMFRMLYAG